jgi:RNA polymerase sigma factor (sigma-70 family)
MPPPAEGFVARRLVGPALRTQPDGRLVKLVRDGYEAAFEEIVRRYGHRLHRYAATIAGGSAEDVTQDAFSKALLALRRDGAEIELRPWLFRIVRNTALNDLRDRPPSADELAEALTGGGGNPAEEVERREELAELIRRLQALPDPQRAAIVMRELEGLGHDEIAAALGVSGGAARQAIHRARTTLRDGLGMTIPLPLLKLILEGGGQTAEIAAGGAGAGVVLKAATATVLVAGTLGAGMALHGSHETSSATASGRNRHGAGERNGARRLASTSTVSRKPSRSHGGSAAGDSPGPSRGSDATGGSGDRMRGSHGPSLEAGQRDPSAGGRSDPQLSHDGAGSGGGPSTGDDRSGGSDGTPSGSGDGSGSADGSGGGTDGGGEISSSDDGSESNSGPDSGVEEEILGSGSGDSRDSGDGEGFSEQMQPQLQEER